MRRAIVSYAEHPPVLRCVGDEDRTTQGIRRTALSRALCAPSDIVVDLTDLVFADASLMLDLMMLASRLRKAGWSMRLLGAQPHIGVLIEHVGLHRIAGVTVDPWPAAAA